MTNYVIAVDDEEAFLDLHESLLSDLGILENYKLILGKDGEDIVRKISEYKINLQDISLVITDYQMPKLNGLELSIWLRSNGYDGKILFFTAYDSAKNLISKNLSNYAIYSKLDLSVNQLPNYKDLISRSIQA